MSQVQWVGADGGWKTGEIVVLDGEQVIRHRDIRHTEGYKRLVLVKHSHTAQLEFVLESDLQRRPMRSEMGEHGEPGVKISDGPGIIDYDQATRPLRANGKLICGNTMYEGGPGKLYCGDEPGHRGSCNFNTPFESIDPAAAQRGYIPRSEWPQCIAENEKMQAWKQRMEKRVAALENHKLWLPAYDEMSDLTMTKAGRLNKLTTHTGWTQLCDRCGALTNEVPTAPPCCDAGHYWVRVSVERAREIIGNLP